MGYKGLGICCSGCWAIIAAFGVVILPIMGGCLWINSIAFADDMGINNIDDYNNETGTHDLEIWFAEVDKKYKSAAHNCFIAAGIYLIVLIISVCQFRRLIRVKPFKYE